MDKINSDIIDGDTSSREEDGKPQVKSRRKFICAAATGGAVLLTLGSRSAWGTYYGSGGSSWSKKSWGGKKKGFDKICVSAAVYESWRNGDPSSVAHHKKEVEKFDKYWNSKKYKQFTKDRGRKYCVKKRESRWSRWN